MSRQKPVLDRQRVVSYLPAETVLAVDGLALKYGTSRSEMVARIVLRMIEKDTPSEPVKPEPPRAETRREPPPSAPPQLVELPPEPAPKKKPAPAVKYEFQSDLMRRMHGQG